VNHVTCFRDYESVDYIKEVMEIKNQPGKDIWLFGGASLTASLMNAQLVDELQLSIHPILLGEGKPLFQDLKEPMKFTLIDTKKYSTGLVQLFYRLD
jgi:dihydrofolate reductase